LVAFGIGIVPSATTARIVAITLTMSIFCAALQVEEGTFATSYIPTTVPVTRAATGFQEVETSYPAQLDLLGAAVTRGLIGLPLASGETAGMARLGADGGGLKEWGGELLFVS
jgi:hypothetical protein